MPIQTAEQAQNVHGVVPAAVGSYGGGEDFGSPFGGGAGSPPGTTNEAAVPYGGPPSAYPPPGGGDGGDGGPSPVVSTDTGSGSSGGSGRRSGIATLAGAEAAKNFLGVRKPGWEGIINDNIESYGLTGKQNVLDLENLETKQPDFTPTMDLGNPIQNKINDAIGFKALGGDFGVNNQGWGYTSGSGDTQFGIKPSFDGINLGLSTQFADGGPVGVMSLPQGYAAGGGVDPSDWRVLEQIIAAGENPEDYGYENGGPVSEEESYIEDYLESLQQPKTQPPTPEESTPFGGTRERVMDQVEAFDNAPHHIEEPMVGMYGEKVPLSIARRVQGYMEGLDPVKRNLIQEMMQMFRMKKMQEKQQDQDQSGQFFGPQPNEYSI